MPTPSKRRHYFINRELQGRQVRFAWAMLVAGGVAGALLLGFFSAEAMTADGLPHSLFAAKGMVLLAVGVTVAVAAILLSHRLAGPLYRLGQAVDEMIAGNFATAIFLRRKDEGRELAEKLTRLNAVLSGRIVEMRHLAKRLDQHLQELVARAEQSGDCDKARIVLQEMASVNGQLRKILDDFSVRH